MKKQYSFLHFSTIFIAFHFIAIAPLSAANAGTDNFCLETQADPPGKPKGKKRNSLRPVRLFKEGQLDGIFAVGALPTYVMDKGKAIIPPLSLGAEYRLSEQFSLGAMIGYSASQSRVHSYPGGLRAWWKNQTALFSIRPAVHITKLEHWDFYGGFSIGVNVVNLQGISNAADGNLREIEEKMGIQKNNSYASFSGFTGVRRVVSSRLTINGELGLGISLVTIGVSYRMGRR
jgi:hypothetical protein